jgi:hypothetical protein
LLEAEARQGRSSARAITIDNSYAEAEYLVDRRRLRAIRVVERMAQIDISGERDL